MAGYIDELTETEAAVRVSNRDGFGATADALAHAHADLRETTDFLLQAIRAGETDTALAGATAYLRLFSLAAGVTYLAKGGLADTEGEARIALARFAAENILPETASLKRQIIEGATSLAAARAVLN